MIERRSALAAHPNMIAQRDAAVSGTDRIGVLLTERRSLVILQVSAFASTQAQVQSSLAQALDLPPPSHSRSSGDASKSLRCVGPGVWLLVGTSDTLPEATALRHQLGAVATVVDLSHARCALQLRGAAATRTLAKFCGLDLDTSAFPTGSATNTRFGHIGMHLARTDDLPTFELLVFRGYAEFAFEALCVGAAEFGFRVET